MYDENYVKRNYKEKFLVVVVIFVGSFET